MDAIKVLLDSIHKVYPDLVVKSVNALANSGEFNDVLLINDELIFRFPKSNTYVDDLGNEVQLLKYVKSYISLPIPEPIYTSFTCNRFRKPF